MQDEEEASTSGAGSNGASAAADGADGGNMSADMLDMLFREPAMQEMIYKTLPEGMRNPETLEWIRNSPEYRKQLETIMKQQARPPVVVLHAPGEGGRGVGF